MAGHKRDRKHKRHKTGLAVRFASAADFVSEYAENLSAGGLFIRQAQGLVPLTEIMVRIDLPGFQVFEVKARVAHIMDEVMAERLGRSAGAGLQLIEVPDGFDSAMSRYLARLGGRRDFLVLIENEGALRLLDEAGYRVEKTNLDTTLGMLLGSTKVLAVVVPKASAPTYRQMLEVSPKMVPVIGCDHSVDEELLLTELDRLISEATST